MARASLFQRLAAGLLAVAIGTLAAAAEAPAAKRSAEASIPFANRGGILDWQVVDDSTLLLLDRHGQWYRARLQAPAFYLPFSENLAFTTPPSGSLEKFGAVVVRGQKYPIISLTRSDPPAARKPN